MSDSENQHKPLQSDSIAIWKERLAFAQVEAIAISLATWTFVVKLSGYAVMWLKAWRSPPDAKLTGPDWISLVPTDYKERLRLGVGCGLALVLVGLLINPFGGRRQATIGSQSDSAQHSKETNDGRNQYATNRRSEKPQSASSGTISTNDLQRFKGCVHPRIQVGEAQVLYFAITGRFPALKETGDKKTMFISRDLNLVFTNNQSEWQFQEESAPFLKEKTFLIPAYVVGWEEGIEGGTRVAESTLEIMQLFMSEERRSKKLGLELPADWEVRKSSTIRQIREGPDRILRDIRQRVESGSSPSLTNLIGIYLGYFNAFAKAGISLD